jgi:aryl-alcohol dehydrogenase-like predicted oxidoreductase
MKYRALGKSGLELSEIGFGAWALGEAWWGTQSDSDSLKALERAVELGVNHIDTAAFYFSPLRSANELINRALSSWYGDVVVATKVGPARDSSVGWLTTARPDQLRGQVE